MADAEMTKFAKALEKLSVDCGADVKKLLSSCKSSIDSRMDKLKSDMEKITAPNCPEQELDKAQALLNASSNKRVPAFQVSAQWASQSELINPAARYPSPLRESADRWPQLRYKKGLGQD